MNLAKLLCLLLLGVAGTGLMIHYENKLGILRIPIVIVIGLSYLSFFKLLIENWRDGEMVSAREKKAIRVLSYALIGLGLLAFLLNLALRFYK